MNELVFAFRFADSVEQRGRSESRVQRCVRINDSNVDDVIGAGGCVQRTRSLRWILRAIVRLFECASIELIQFNDENDY